MLVLPGAAQKDTQSLGNRSSRLVDDGAFIVDFREPAVGREYDRAQRQKQGG
jgi:hypothetical protein